MCNNQRELEWQYYPLPQHLQFSPIFFSSTLFVALYVVLQERVKVEHGSYNYYIHTVSAKKELSQVKVKDGYITRQIQNSDM